VSQETVYEYDDSFYRYINRGAQASAREMLPRLVKCLGQPVATVLDVGCGAGAWLSVWKSLGAEVCGLDGSYVDPAQRLIGDTEFRATDLARGFSLGRRFDLVQSLEVAEHLPVASAAGFVSSLCAHGDVVLFSAAPPGQGGENHLNEQPYDYWRELFRQQGFDLYDVVRPQLAGNSRVMPWYRFNTFLYLNTGALPELAEALAAYRVPEDRVVADISPWSYRLRKRLISMLPVQLSTALARLKKAVFGFLLKINPA